MSCMGTYKWQTLWWESSPTSEERWWWTDDWRSSVVKGLAGATPNEPLRLLILGETFGKLVEVCCMSSELIICETSHHLLKVLLRASFIHTYPATSHSNVWLELNLCSIKHLDWWCQSNPFRMKSSLKETCQVSVPRFKAVWEVIRSNIRITLTHFHRHMVGASYDVSLYQAFVVLCWEYSIGWMMMMMMIVVVER